MRLSVPFVMATLVCPSCHTLIDPTARCESHIGLVQCMERQGHDGYHWTDLGHPDGAVTIWTGVYITKSCSARRSLSDWCQKPAGHDGQHMRADRNPLIVVEELARAV